MDLLMIFGFFTVPIGLVISAVAIFKLKGIGWRLAAAVPLIAVAAYFVFVLIPDWQRDPTSHNLFPFEIGMHFWLTFPYALALLFAHRAIRQAQGSPQAPVAPRR